jgi:hypothetical protein
MPVNLESVVLKEISEVYIKHIKEPLCNEMFIVSCIRAISYTVASTCYGDANHAKESEEIQSVIMNALDQWVAASASRYNCELN